LELRVTAGKATGYSAVVDNVTGDGFTVQPQRITPGTWADLSLNGVSRGPGRFNTFFRTDARLVNPDAFARTVTVSGVSLLAGGQPFPATATITVPARAVREVTDVLQTLLHAPDGTNGALRFETDGPLLVLGRTSNIRADGSTFGAVQKTSPASEFLRIGRPGTFVGLIQSSATPGFRTNVGFLSGPAGAVVDLTLKDRAGATVATRPAAVSMGAFAFYQPPLSDLFPGTAIPENAALEITPTDGTVDVYTSFIDNGTGDPVISPFTLPAIILPPIFTATSPCPAMPGSGGGVPDGTNLSRVDLDTTRYPDALCNDGTPGLFYVRKGTGTGANRWILNVTGGGSCFTGTTCANRWCSIDTGFGANLMTNRYAAARGLAGNGLLSQRADNAFGNFNYVFIYYCSSDAWMGRVSDRPLVDDTGRAYTIHFQGARILEAVLTELRAGVTYRDAATDQQMSLPDLDDAEVVLFVGESAGSAGVQRNVDRVGEYLKSHNRTGNLVFRALLDAANEPSNEAFPLYESSARSGLRATAVVVSGRFDESCIAMHSADPWRCGDAAHVRENHLTTPFFLRQDLIDPNTLDDFGTETWAFGTQLFEYAQFTWDHLDAVSRIRSTAEEKGAMTMDPGLYGPHCDKHTAIRDNAAFLTDKIAQDNGLFTYHDTFRNWLVGGSPRVVLQPRPTTQPAPKSAECGD
ncbi:MAG: hypothetical protein JNK60_20870, partial [Acidobacteria bacterium]|nr:hypothetical protein [Acidobacteriota bacterium]